MQSPQKCHFSLLSPSVTEIVFRVRKCVATTIRYCLNDGRYPLLSGLGPYRGEESPILLDLLDGRFGCQCVIAGPDWYTSIACNGLHIGGLSGDEHEVNI